MILWPSLYDIDAYSESPLDFTRHIRVKRKDQAPGFGPYQLTPPEVTCYKHSDAKPRASPHRCDECIAWMTHAVFDADCGPIDESRRLLEGVTHTYYSTFSHSANHPAFRLVIPLANPVHPSKWAAVRLAIRRKFAVPADPKLCSGRSHFYYLPSCPEDATPEVYTSTGILLDPAPFTPNGPNAVRRMVSLDNWTPPKEPEVPVDLAPLKERLASRRYPGDKGEYLKRCLQGEPLAPHGERNKAAFLVCGIVGYELAEQPLSVLRHIMRGSVGSMIAAGSKLTWEKIDRMLITAMRKRAEDNGRENVLRSQLQETMRKLRENNHNQPR